MDHPNVARILDGGTTALGQPFFVMELIQGQPLTHYCDEQRLGIEQRLKLFIDVCNGVQHAHQKGIIHRDLKPGNILVSLVDGKPVPKIIDFGLARAIEGNQRLTDQSLMTGVGQILGTLRYMSPEQAQEEELTHQTDLYSLGVVIYELLAGRTPFQAENLSRLIYRIVHDAPPPVRTLRADIPPELEAIVMKALARDRAQRYAMGNEMAADLSQAFDHLDGVEAHVEEQERFESARKLEFFSEFSDAELWEVVRAASGHRFTGGDRIVSEGAIEDFFYIIVSGDVMVKKGSRVLSSLAAGDCFGEMGYFGKVPRSANIVALNDVSALRLGASHVEQVSAGAQLRFLRAFVKTLVSRLGKTSETLARP